ncbi:PadR family transcriptional regulator [Microbacterium resistens]|uniref:PadR family transcriptional regulator n=1 Tax=Microbacterium resistens TaxID=156977 RepID=A0ABY3RSU8_9MICO|nr:PadR family transcriptional regulator [Microbacterium resistens]UGS27029.1 PadR family transcriptional regulator [Microbacterium resistens]
MKLEHLLLGLIARGPSTGYEIMKYLDTHGRFLRSNTTMSQVYRSLSRMAERGWVAFSVDERPGAQDAKVYRLTPEGRTVFIGWLRSPYAPPSRFQDPDFGARLSLGIGLMSKEDVLELIETELNARYAQRVKYRFRDRRLGPLPEGADEPFARALSDRLHYNGARDLDDYIRTLESLRTDILDDALERTNAELARTIVIPDDAEAATVQGADR